MLALLVTQALAQEVPHAARVVAAEEGYALAVERQKVGGVTVSEVCAWSVRWYEAARDAGRTDAAALHVARMSALHGQVDKDYAVGTASALDRQTARYCVAEAQVWAAVAPER